jgi:hypothetical protein
MAQREEEAKKEEEEEKRNIFASFLLCLFSS